MPGQLSLRNVPPEIHDWMREEKLRAGRSQQEILLDALQDAYRHRGRRRDRTLFDEVEPDPPVRQVERLPGLPFRFIDLFAGIGGMRLGLERLGGECVYTCEIDKHCRKTYEAWFGDSEIAEDITAVDPVKIPAHDVLAAGFPCQPFSVAGVSKKNSLGRSHGFQDKAQGTLFYNLAEIIRAKRPPVVLLENVKNLRSHDKGRTWQTILEILEGLNYAVFSKIIDAADYVPQHRERIFIVCFDAKMFTKSPPFQFPEPPNGPAPRLGSILEDQPESKYTLTDNLWKYLVDYAAKHRKKGNGFGYGIGDPDGVSRTLSARYYKDGSEILIAQKGKNPRRLTPSECQKLMGFPDWEFPVSDMQAYRQCGNAVVPLVIEQIAAQIVKVMRWQILRKKKNGCLLK